MAQVRTLITQLQAGSPDRKLMSEGLSAHLDALAIADFSASLGPLGIPESMTEMRADRRGGLVQRMFRVKLSGRSMRVSTYFTQDGRLGQFIVYP